MGRLALALLPAPFPAPSPFPGWLADARPFEVSLAALCALPCLFMLLFG